MERLFLMTIEEFFDYMIFSSLLVIMVMMFNLVLWLWCMI